MCSKIYGSIVLLLSVVVALFVINVSVDSIEHVMKFLKFFDVMLPILAVGALIKYIFCGKKGKCCGKCGGKCNSNGACSSNGQ